MFQRRGLYLREPPESRTVYHSRGAIGNPAGPTKGGSALGSTCGTPPGSREKLARSYPASLPATWTRRLA